MDLGAPSFAARLHVAARSPLEPLLLGLAALVALVLGVALALGMH